MRQGQSSAGGRRGVGPKALGSSGELRGLWVWRCSVACSFGRLCIVGRGLDWCASPTLERGSLPSVTEGLAWKVVSS